MGYILMFSDRDLYIEYEIRKMIDKFWRFWLIFIEISIFIDSFIKIMLYFFDF